MSLCSGSKVPLSSGMGWRRRREAQFIRSRISTWSRVNLRSLRLSELKSWKEPLKPSATINRWWRIWRPARNKHSISCKKQLGLRKSTRKSSKTAWILLPNGPCFLRGNMRTNTQNLWRMPRVRRAEYARIEVSVAPAPERPSTIWRWITGVLTGPAVTESNPRRLSWVRKVTSRALNSKNSWKRRHSSSKTAQNRSWHWDRHRSR